MQATSTTSVDFDLVIAGGGMAGSMLALALLRQAPALKVAIIEQAETPVSKASFDSRSIALAAASVELLQRWQLWPQLAQQACPIKTIAVSDRGHFGKTWLSADEYRLPALGQVIEVEHIGAALYQALAEHPNLSRLQPRSIAAIDKQQAWQQLTLDDGKSVSTRLLVIAIAAIDKQQAWQQLTLDDGKSVSTRLLVIAEGGASNTRQLAGFSLTEQPYPQAAIIANLALSSSHQYKAFERFTEHGPIALLPLTQNRYSLVWTVPPEQVPQLLALSDSEFLAHIQQAFGYRAGVFTAVGSRAAYPLVLKQSQQVVNHRTALLGNSLHNLHPIAGQGFNLALRDIACLSQLLSEQGLADAGGYALLRAYQQQRQADMQQVIWLTDDLVR
ncbi:MAG: 2-octaprenyl-6-methoxyphenyl hydroxylase, partial [Alishewanella sp. 32-51-5]